MEGKGKRKTATATATTIFSRSENKPKDSKLDTANSLIKVTLDHQIQDVQLVRLQFVVFSFNVASEITEIGRISVVMHVSDQFNYGKLQLIDILLPEKKFGVLSGEKQ